LTVLPRPRVYGGWYHLGCRWISSDVSRSPLGAHRAVEAEPAAGAEHLQAYGPAKTIIMSDPPEHDRARRQVMRHFGPPHSAHFIPDMEPYIVRLCNELLDKAKTSGATRLDVVDDYAYPVPVSVICKILGVPLEAEPTFHAWIYDFLAGLDVGPEAATEEGQARAEKGRVGQAALAQYLGELIEHYLPRG
jgi:fatty acid omega-hydroxylase